MSILKQDSASQREKWEVDGDLEPGWQGCVPGKDPWSQLELNTWVQIPAGPFADCAIVSRALGLRFHIFDVE